MASVVAENWEYNEKQDDFESLELSHVNQGLLMSLLDETQVDDCDDDERLTKVIQSLEAEINPDSHDSNDESSGQDWSMPQHIHHDLDHHNWMDVEFAPSSPSGGDMEKYWSFENSEQGIAGTSVLDQWPDDETHFVSSVINDHT